MSLRTHLPMPLYRLWNLFADIRIWWRSRNLAKATFAPTLTPKGLLALPEKSGPEYPQVFIDLERLYRRYRFRVDRKVLMKAGRTMEGYRGRVSLEKGEDARSVTLEFFYSAGSVFITFLPIEEGEERRCVRVLAKGGLPPDTSVRLVEKYFSKLEFRLLPPEAHAGDDY